MPHLSFRRTNSNNKADTTRVADGKRVVLEWLSPLEPRKGHRGIGIDWVAEWATGFLRTSLHVAAKVVTELLYKPVLLCCGSPGDGGLTRYVYIRYRLRLLLKGVGDARCRSSTDSSLVVDRPCDRIDAGDIAMACAYQYTAFILSMDNPRQSYLGHCDRMLSAHRSRSQMKYRGHLRIRMGGWWSQALAP